jgi:hypothetical protein
MNGTVRKDTMVEPNVRDTAGQEEHFAGVNPAMPVFDIA